MSTSTGFITNTQTLVGAATGAAIKLFPPPNRANSAASFLQSSVGINITGTLNTTLEWSGDDYTAVGYSEANGNWFPFTGMTALTASATATIGAAMTMVRIVNNSGTGIAVLQVCQQAT